MSYLVCVICSFKYLNVVVRFLHVNWVKSYLLDIGQLVHLVYPTCERGEISIHM